MTNDISLTPRKPGRKPHADRPVNWRLSLPESVAIRLELLCIDPLTGKPSYAIRSRLVTRLIEQYLALDQERREKLVEMLQLKENKCQTNQPL